MCDGTENLEIGGGAGDNNINMKGEMHNYTFCIHTFPEGRAILGRTIIPVSSQSCFRGTSLPARIKLSDILASYNGIGANCFS